MPVHLPPFDPSREFIAQRFFRFHGRIYQRKEAFEKDSASPRELLKLYETRNITYAGVDLTTIFPPRTPKEKANARSIAQRATGPEGTKLPTDPGKTEAEELTEANEALAQKTANGSDHETLFKKAIGLKGVRKAMTKIEIARRLVEAGRVGDGTA